MTPVEFNALTSRKKWDNYKKMSGIFICPNCKYMDDPKMCSPFPGASMHCEECDYELTRRTGGGQSDPFGWILSEH